MVKEKTLLTNFVEEEGKVKVGDSRLISSLGYGTYKGIHTNKDGIKVKVTLSKALYVPKLWTNLFSITAATSLNNTKVICEENLISVVSGDKGIHFNKILSHGKGRVLVADINQDDSFKDFDYEVAHLMSTKMTYDDLHKSLGHANSKVIEKTAKRLGIKINGKTEDIKCPDCALGKIRIKNFGHEDNETSEKGEKINLDISSVKHISFGGSKFWLLLQDDYTNYLWSFFLSSKNELSTKVIEWLKTTEKNYEFKVKTIKLDNSGENRSLEVEVKKDSKLKIKFEFTAPNSPQQNGKIERKFATIWGKVRSMLNTARVPWSIRAKLWAQCANHCTDLENISVNKGKRSPYEKIFKKKPKWIKNLRIFGELAVIHNNLQIQSKLKNRGNVGMYIGHSDNHAKEVCQFLTLNTFRIILSRSYVFINMMYDKYFELNESEISKIKSLTPGENYEEDTLVENFIDINEIDEEGEENVEELKDEESEDEDEEGEFGREINGKSHGEDAFWDSIKPTSRELRNLQTFYNPDPLRFTDREIAEDALLNHICGNYEVLLQSSLYDGSPEPKNLYEARTSKDWTNWWKAISTEFESMHEKDVWEIVRKSEVPEKRRTLQSRWVFVQKDDGRFRARCVAKGFSQIPGKDFTENHSPVLNDTTFHIILVLKILFKLESGQFDIETAFLYGELEESIWMVFPEGYTEFLEEKEMFNGKRDPEIYCLKLKKSIYGLVQAARQWWKKFKAVIESMGYKACDADPCLFVKNNTNSSTKSFIAIYVDDGGIFSTEDNIKEVLEELSKVFKVKYLGKLENFLGCRIIENKERNTIYLHQPKLLKNMEITFGKYLDKVRSYKTPAGPKTSIVRPVKGDPLISAEMQKLFRSGVGMLLWLVKHSRPDLNNATRELSKVADGATEGHWKELLRTISYTVKTKDIALKIKPTKESSIFYLEGISDSNYAEDKETRISVFGYVIYLCGSPIAWKSKSGKSVTLSSTEAEYVGISEVAKEILFVKQILEGVGIVINYPITIKCDNIGAIYLSNNYSTSQRTKHIDTRFHFVRGYVEENILKIVFVRSEDNDADIFTKNVTEELFKKHSEKFLGIPT
jgi:hypothetical protein